MKGYTLSQGALAQKVRDLRLSGASQWRRVKSSLHSQQIVGSSPGRCPGSTGCPLSVPLLSYEGPWCVVPCLWDIAHKRSLAILQKKQGSDPGGRFLLREKSKFPTVG